MDNSSQPVASTSWSLHHVVVHLQQILMEWPLTFTLWPFNRNLCLDYCSETAWFLIGAADPISPKPLKSPCLSIHPFVCLVVAYIAMILYSTFHWISVLRICIIHMWWGRIVLVIIWIVILLSLLSRFGHFKDSHHFCHITIWRGDERLCILSCIYCVNAFLFFFSLANKSKEALSFIICIFLASFSLQFIFIICMCFAWKYITDHDMLSLLAMHTTAFIMHIKCILEELCFFCRYNLENKQIKYLWVDNNYSQC